MSASALVRGSTLAATCVALSLAAAATAHAAPVTFTFDPTAAGLAGTAFTADKLNILDFARVDLGTPGATTTPFTESGFLQVNNASLGTTTFDPPGNRSTYSLYLAFNGTGTQSASSFTTSSTGTFNSLNYTLFGANGVSTFSVAGGTPTVTNASPAVAIATGSLINGATALNVLAPGQIGPSASVTEAVDELIPAFFASPSNVSLTLAGAFTNDVNIVSVVNGGTAFTLNGGGGDVTFTSTSVPEPASLALLGGGLAGLGLIRRRKAA